MREEARGLAWILDVTESKRIKEIGAAQLNKVLRFLSPLTDSSLRTLSSAVNGGVWPAIVGSGSETGSAN